MEAGAGGARVAAGNGRGATALTTPQMNASADATSGAREASTADPKALAAAAAAADA